MKSDQYESQKAYSNVIRHYSQPRQEFRMVENLSNEDLNPRLPKDQIGSGPVEELLDIQVDEVDQEKKLKIGSNLSKKVQSELKNFLKNNLDVFTWSHDDMVGIDPEVMCHRLNLDSEYPPKRQKRRPLNPERYEALKEEVDKLIKNGFIRETQYPDWISNPVLVKKPNGKWRTCVDFSDLNKAVQRTASRCRESISWLTPQQDMSS